MNTADRRIYVRKDPMERFMEKVVRDEKSGCWLWSGCLTQKGYGQFFWSWDNGENRKLESHRAAWALFKGEIPEGMHVLHKCDVPRCVNPEHLYLGTHMDNMNDMHNRGRAHPGFTITQADNRGERNGMAKLSLEEASFIKNSTLSLAEICCGYGISKSTVCDIRSGRRWRHA